MVMGKMREYTKVVLWIVIVAFVGTIVFAWGMGSFKSHDDPLARGIIGVIDGQEISARYFQALYEQEYSQALEQTEDGEITDEQAKEMRDRVWARIVDEVIMGRIRDKYGVAVSDKELVEFLQRYPLPELQSNPAFQTDGRFDYNKYISALQDPSINWLPVEQYARSQLAMLKTRRLITAPFYVTEDDVRREFEAKNLSVDIEYAVFPLKGKPDLKRPTDTELQAYYDANKEKFGQDQISDKVILTLAEFPAFVDPHVEDSIITLLDSLRNLALSGESFAKLADEYSQDETTGEGGDIPWTNEGGFVPEFERELLNLKKGEISKPFRTEFGYHIVLLEDTREYTDPKTEKHIKKYKTRHILMEPESFPGEVAEYEIGIKGLSRAKNPKDFAKKAEKLGATVTVTEPLGRTATFPQLGSNSPQLLQFAFESGIGDVSKMFRTRMGYLVACINDTIAAKAPPLSEIRDIVAAEVEMQRLLDGAEKDAVKFIKDLRNPSQFRRLAVRRGADYGRKDGFLRKTYIEGYFPDQPKIAAEAFDLTPEDPISEPVRCESGVMVIHLLNKKEFNQELYEAQRDSIYWDLAGKKQKQLYQAWYAEELKEAEIEDYRSSYYSEI